MSDDKKFTYFDDSTQVLTPLYIVLALGVVVGLVFFG